MTNEEREEAIQYFKNLKLIQADAYMQEAMQAAISALSQPQITEGAYKQVMWERDTAIKQLNDLGYEFGEKIEPCEDTISRQATLASIKNLYPDIPVMDIFGSRRKWLEKYAPYFECENAIEQLPPVIPQPKIGKWIVDGSVDCYLDKVKCHCSECGKKKEFPANYDHIKQKLSISYKYPEFIDNYCPNCGARMIESEG